MKILTTFFLLLTVSIVLSQTPKAPKFKHATPIWQYNLFSENFKNITSQHSKYSVVRPVSDPNYAIINDAFYFFNWKNDPKAIVGGYSIGKVNLKTYNLEYLYDSPYNNNNSEFYDSPYTIFYKEKYLEIFGNRGSDVIGLGSPYLHIYRRRHDINTGKLILDQTDVLNDKPVLTNQGTAYSIINENEKFMHISSIAWRFDSIRLELVFSEFDTLMNQKEIYKITHDPQQALAWNSVQASFPFMLNDTILVWWIKQDPPTENEKLYNWLYFINLSNPKNITYKKIDASHRIFSNRFTYNTRFYIRDEKLVITDVWFDVSQNINEAFSYVLDQNGNELNYTSRFDVDGKSDHFLVQPLRLSDTMSYYLAFPSQYSNKSRSYDIIKVDQEGKSYYVSSLYTTDDTNAEDYLSIQSILTNDDILISNGLYTKDNAAKNSSAWSHGFRLADLIKGTLTSSQDIPIEDKDLTLGPNPTSGIIHINSKNKIESILVTESNGAMYKVEITNNNILDLSDKPNGLYHLSIRTDGGYMTRKTVVKVK